MDGSVSFGACQTHFPANSAVGFMTGLNYTGGDASFSRRYLDPNRKTYSFHADEDFDTDEGIETTREIGEIAERFNITYRLGTVPQ